MALSHCRSSAGAFELRAREETRESRGMPCLFLNTERVLGGKPPKKSGFRRHLAGSKMPKETFFTAISRWRVISRLTLDASGRAGTSIYSRSDLRAFCCDAPVAHGDGSDTALKYSDQKRKRRSSMRRVAPGVRSYPSRLCRAGSGFRFSIWNSLVLDPVIIGRLQLGAARCCANRGHRPVAGRRTEFRRSTAASRWRHLCGGRLGIGLSRPARRVPPRPKG